MEIDDQKPEVLPTRTEEPPKPEAPDWLYKNIEEASKNTATIYAIYMGFLFYAAFTALTTPDRGLVLNEKAHLPIINVDVSANGFFVLAPLLLIVVFFYLQLYLQRQKDLMDHLDTRYPETERTERRLRVYPWIVNFARYHAPGVTNDLQIMTVKFCLFIAPPIVLNIISLSFIRKHDPFWSYIVAFMAFAGTLIVLFFWRKYEAGRTEKRKTRWVIADSCAVVIILALPILTLWPLIPWAQNGAPLGEWSEWMEREASYVRSFLCVDLSYQKLVTEPTVDYPPNAQYPGLRWQNLRKAHLEGANLYSSVLKRADLSEANLGRAALDYAILDGANLYKANLRDANLEYARLDGADLRGADLRDANLEYTRLDGADLRGADLRGALFTKASLYKANLRLAKLSEAKLSEADLREAKLDRAELDKANLESANLQKASLNGTTLYGAALHLANLQNTRLDMATLQGAGLSGADLRMADLTSTNLSEADLWSADLRGAQLDHTNLSGASFDDADLRGASFKEADLSGADLRRADLRGSLHLTIDQLAKCKTLYQAKLPPGLLKEIEKKHRNLRENPPPERERGEP